MCESKVCKVCGIEKSLTKFNPKNRTCRSCIKKKIYSKRKSTNVPKHLLRLSTLRARQYNIEHTITIEDIVIPDMCPYLKLPFDISDSRFSPMSPTVDRIDSSKGYIPGNIEVISLRANTIKNISSKEATIKKINTLKSKNKHIHKLKTVFDLLNIEYSLEVDNDITIIKTLKEVYKFNTNDGTIIHKLS